MARAVYSVNLCRLSGSGVSTTFEVPATDVCVLRDIDVIIESGGTLTAAVVQESTTGVQVWFAQTDADTLQAFAWRGRQVFPPGALLTFESAGPGGVQITASGYLLSSV
jgi:hypothetical protein